MYKTIEAMFDNGVLRPIAPLEGLANGQQVTITVFDAEELRQPENGSAADFDPAAFFRQMENEGVVVRFPEPQEPPAHFEPIVVSGKPVSETILEDRG